MRTVFTAYDLKEIIKSVFNGNSEEILITDEDEQQSTVNITEYLNIEFYSWKDRLVSVGNSQFPYENWLESLKSSLNKSYGLIELIDMEITASQDIDSATMYGKCSFLIQSNKVSILDYYLTKIRNSLLGVPQDIQNSFGDTIKAYILIGALLYDNEPSTTQLGETMEVSFNFSISYLTDALNYNDTPMYLSFNGMDYMQIPYTKATWQNIFSGQAYTNQVTPNRTGVVNTNLTTSKTFSFYDFNKELTLTINDLFWSVGAYSIDGTVNTSTEVNIPVWVKVVSNNHTYIYKDTITSMQKDFSNSDFTTSSISLKGGAK